MRSRRLSLTKTKTIEVAKVLEAQVGAFVSEAKTRFGCASNVNWLEIDTIVVW